MTQLNEAAPQGTGLADHPVPLKPADWFTKPTSKSLVMNVGILIALSIWLSFATTQFASSRTDERGTPDIVRRDRGVRVTRSWSRGDSICPWGRSSRWLGSPRPSSSPRRSGRWPGRSWLASSWRRSRWAQRVPGGWDEDQPRHRDL